jgi:hypothetical protein
MMMRMRRLKTDVKRSSSRKKLGSRFLAVV